MAFNREAVAKYARKWALSTNPDYPRRGNDCTSFVSQCLLAGGWRMAGRHSFWNRKDDNVWWYGDDWPWATASYTWGGAQNFYNFLWVSKRGTQIENPLQLDRGDVIQMAKEGHVHHSMVVVKKEASDLLLCYHTDDHLDEPLSNIQKKYPDDTYFYWKISDSNY